MYQPASIVVHHEGVSHGTDLNSGVKAHQKTNQRKFTEIWKSVLSVSHYKNGSHVLRARDSAKSKRVMLIVDHYVPEPDRDAGSRNMIDIMLNLQHDGWIIKFWPANCRYDSKYTCNMQQLGIETFYEPWRTDFREWLGENAFELDAILLSRPEVAEECLPVVEELAPSAVRIYYGHDLHAARLRLQAHLEKNHSVAHDAEQMEIRERQIWRRMDAVLYPSEEEADVVRRLEPSVDAHSIVPFVFDTFPSAPPPRRSQTIMFVAGFAHPPNIDAARWLVKEIMPLVHMKVPRARLWIVGSNPSDAVRALASESVDVTGYVTAEELDLRYSEARVACVPLRFGAGVKLKVVEALHSGIPLVTTPVGVQGLPGLSEVIPVGADPADLASAICNLLSDDDLWADQSRGQIAFAEARFSRAAGVAALKGCIASAFDKARSRACPSEA